MSNPLVLSSCRRGAGCLRMLCISQRNKDKMTINKHQTQDSLGTQGFRYSRCVAMPGEYSYFAPVPKITGDFFSPFELLEACFVLRQRKTATISIEFAKEVKYYMQEEETSPQKTSKTKAAQRKPHQKSCLRRKTRQNIFRLRRNRPFSFRLRRNRQKKQIDYGELGPAHFFSPAAKKGAAQEKRGAANRTMPSERGEKNGIYDKNVRRRNSSPSILRPGMDYAGSGLSKKNMS